nr:hypothetical protein [Tanacetum cinerariifolium]
LKESLSKLKGKDVVNEAVPLHSINPECNPFSSGISSLQQGELSLLAVKTSSGSGNSSLVVGMP